MGMSIPECLVNRDRKTQSMWMTLFYGLGLGLYIRVEIVEY